MFALLTMLAVASVVGILGSVIALARDGYHRQPKATFARTV